MRRISVVSGRMVSWLPGSSSREPLRTIPATASSTIRRRVFVTYDSNGNHAGGETHFATLAAHLH